MDRIRFTRNRQNMCSFGNVLAGNRSQETRDLLHNSLNSSLLFRCPVAISKEKQIFTFDLPFRVLYMQPVKRNRENSKRDLQSKAE